MLPHLKSQHDLAEPPQKSFSTIAERSPDHAYRPALSILTLPLAAVCAGLIFSERLSIDSNASLFHQLPGLILFLIIALVGAGTMSTMLFIRARKTKIVLLTLCALLAASAAGFNYWGGVNVDARGLANAPRTHASFTVTGDLRGSAVFSTSDGTITTSDGTRGSVRIQWGKDTTPLPQGMSFVAEYRFTPRAQKDAYLLEQGICGTVTVLEYEVTGFGTNPFGIINRFRAHNVALLKEIGGEGAALLSGVLLGNTEQLRGGQTEQSFRTTGLAHLIAVSGSHLVIIASLCGWVLSKLPGKRAIEITLIIVMLCVYVILTGLHPSAIRAGVMSAVSYSAFFAQRRSHTPTALCVAAISMLLIHPPNAFSIGFWMSVSAVIGIALFLPLVQSWCLALYRDASSRVKAHVTSQKRNKQPGTCQGGCSVQSWLRTQLGKRRHVFRNGGTSLIQMCALTFTAQAATFPLSVSTFSLLPLISPLANLVTIPLITVLVGGGMIALCLGIIVPAVGHALLQILCGLGDVVSGIAFCFTRLPFSCIPLNMELVPVLIVTLVSATFLYCVWPRPHSRVRIKLLITIALLPAAILVAAPYFQPPQIIMLSVGQGDCFIIREGSHTVMIDTGPSQTALVKALARHGITHLDALVITHLDADHCGAMQALLGVVQVDRVLFAADLPISQSSHQALTMAQTLAGADGVCSLYLGDYIRLSTHLSFEVVGPDHVVTEGENADSVCLLLSYDVENDGIPEHDALFTGDAESPQLAQMIEGGRIHSCEILKLGHHGSRISIRPEQVEYLGVQIALISAGVNNRYGHPSTEALAALHTTDATVFRTDQDGDVILTFTPTAMRVQCVSMG